MPKRDSSLQRLVWSADDLAVTQPLHSIGSSEMLPAHSLAVLLLIVRLLFVCGLRGLVGLPCLCMNTISTDMQIALGRTIRELRKRRGFSQESFADEVGIHRTYMGAVERGERNVSLKNLMRIAKTLGVPLSSLIAEAEAVLKADESR